MNFIRTILSRVLAAPLAAGAGYLVNAGIIPADYAADAQTAVIGFVGLVVYGIAHKLLDGAFNVNPGDGTT